MRADGVYLKDIAKHLGMCRQQVARWLEWNTLHPDMRGRHTKHGLIDPYIEYLRQRLDEGCTNQSQLWREICAQGFSGCRTLVGRWIRQQAKMAKVREKATSKITIPSTTELSWLMFHTPERLTDEQNQWLARLRANEQIDILYEQAHQFIKMVRKRLGSDWQEWLQNAKQSAIKEVVNFAIGLARDSEAVHQALIQPYSNGRTEGHVNRLKFIKRQMYGRASFKLLRIRVLLSQK